ncbi:MAG: polysaccharide deacetylase family protein [Bacilli bacterium]|jgi:peptidoglycan/xylan/chitin deacetylase (PgdA/CDA1 family)
MKFDRKKSKKYTKAKNFKITKKIFLSISLGLLIITAPSIILNQIQNNRIISPSNKSLTASFSQPSFSPSREYYVPPKIEKEVLEEPQIEKEIIEEQIIEEQKKENPNDEKNVEKFKTVALSFDDGPSKKTTPLILDILKEYNVSATFFVLGTNIRNNQELILNIYQDGHEIGNHGYDHSSFKRLNEEELINQINKTSQSIEDITGEAPNVVRPPYGDITDAIKEKINNPIILWSIDAQDWHKVSPETIVNKVLNNLEDGRIILMHDIHERTVEATKILIPKILERDYKIVTINELFKEAETELEKGKVYQKAKK